MLLNSACCCASTFSRLQLQFVLQRGFFAFGRLSHHRIPPPPPELCEHQCQQEKNCQDTPHGIFGGSAAAVKRVSLFRLNETVANTANGIEVFCGRPELVAQTAHVGVHRSRINKTVVFPDVAQQLLPGLHTSAALSQEQQQLELGRRQLNRFAAPADEMTRRIDQQVPELQSLLVALLPRSARCSSFVTRKTSSRGLNGFVT